MTRFDKYLYIMVRRAVRGQITRYPMINRILGDPLRSLERRWFSGKHILLHKEEDTLDIQGLKLRYRPEDHDLVDILILNGEYEPEVVQFIQNFLQSGMIFVDLGAHIGYLTLIAAQIVRSDGHVYAFEPNPMTCEILRQNVAGNEQSNVVTVIQKAVADKIGKVHFLLSDSSVSAKIKSDEGNLADTSIIVETIALDEFFAQVDYPSINLIKMDIEGAELSALQGMSKLVEHSNSLKLIIEVNLPHIEQSGISVGDFIKMLQEHGFNRFRALKSHHDQPLSFPSDLHRIEELARRCIFNLLCEK